MLTANTARPANSLPPPPSWCEGGDSVSRIRGIFEHRTEPLLPGHRFFWRVVGFLALSAVAIGVALGVGVLGYHYFAGLLFIGAASLVLAPFVHRIMHTIHLEDD